MHQNAPEGEGKRFKTVCLQVAAILLLSVCSCDTDWHFKADGVGRYKQACGEGREVPGATNSSAGVGFFLGHHAICPPLLLTLTEVLTQGGKHPDLQANTHRLRAGAAGRAHVDKVVQSGVVQPV